MHQDLPTIEAADAPWTGLRRFLARKPPAEQCELCSLPLPPKHQHLVEPRERRLSCVCDACAVLFSESGTTQYRRVPRDGKWLNDFALDEARLRNFGVPIALAFFFYSSPQGQTVALYPSPAGPTEAALDAADWDALVRENPPLAKLRPDVEALLVNRLQGRRDALLAPIDECYKLVGLIRAHWRGISGGKEVWEQVAEFFDDLKARSVAA
jgi:hypothetical protein